MASQPAHPEQRKILTEFCEKELVRQRDYLIKKYKLRDYNPQLFFNWKRNAVHSWGGALEDDIPFLMLMPHEIWQHVGKTGKYIFNEYEFLHDKPGIGMGRANWKQHISWTMAHELSHTICEIERFAKKAMKVFPGQTATEHDGHGPLWQSVYYDLRVHHCGEDHYPVEAIDFSNEVHYSHFREKGEHRFIIYKGNKPFAWYVRQDGVFWGTNARWRKSGRTRSGARTPRELVRNHQNS
ncbi:hypothetical protein [Xanthomonas phage BUDD]|nr:hypothetical protein [Xanthomonas phage BUDD]